MDPSLGFIQNFQFRNSIRFLSSAGMDRICEEESPSRAYHFIPIHLPSAFHCNCNFKAPHFKGQADPLQLVWRENWQLSHGRTRLTQPWLEQHSRLRSEERDLDGDFYIVVALCSDPLLHKSAPACSKLSPAAVRLRSLSRCLLVSFRICLSRTDGISLTTLGRTIRSPFPGYQ